MQTHKTFPKQGEMAKKLKAGTTEPKHKDKWTMIKSTPTSALESEAETQ